MTTTAQTRAYLVPYEEDEQKAYLVPYDEEREQEQKKRKPYLVPYEEYVDQQQGNAYLVPYDDTVTSQPPPASRPLSFNLRKALINQGVDPDTMQVYRPYSEMGFFERVVRAFKGGDARMKMDWRMAQAAASDEDVYQNYRQEELLYEQALALNPITQNEANNIIEKAFFGAADSLAGMTYSMASKAVTGALAAGTVAAVVGTPGFVGDDILLGGAFLTRVLGPNLARRVLGKAAVAQATSLFGAATPYYFQGKGDLYRDMREMGVDHLTAQRMAGIGAAPYAAIEFINEFIPSSAVIGKLFPSMAKPVKPMISKSITQAMMRMSWAWAKSTAGEASEEFWQEVNNEVFKNIAASMGGVPEAQAGAWDVFRRGTEAMVQAIGPSMVLGALPVAHHGYKQAGLSRTYNAVQDLHVAITGQELGNEAARYVTASLHGEDVSQLKDIISRPREERLGNMLDVLGRTDAELSATIKEAVESGALPGETALTILESPSPRAAMLAYRMEGDKGLRTVTKEMEHLRKIEAEPELTAKPEVTPTVEPMVEPTVEPTAEPMVEPTVEPDLTVEPEPTTEQHQVVDVPVEQARADEIATRADLMQFKQIDEAESGINVEDKITSESWDDLKGGVLLLWQPVEPSKYGLTDNQKYIVANGHHRLEFGKRMGREGYNAQVIREADGYSVEQAREIAAEVNIADGKGTIYDQVKYLRNAAATHGKDEAMARGKHLGARGRQAAKIAFLSADRAGQPGESHLIDAFINEVITPQQAEAIVDIAPNDAGWQQVGIKIADDLQPDALRNKLAATMMVARDAGIVTVESAQRMLEGFGEDSIPEQMAEAIHEIATDKQKQIQRDLAVVRAGKRLGRQQQQDIANRYGFKVEGGKDLKQFEAQLAEEQRRWKNWHTDAELSKELTQLAMEKTGITQDEIDAVTIQKEAKTTPKAQELPGTEGQFNLMGEDASAKMQEIERAKQERELAEAKAEMDKQTPDMFAEPAPAVEPTPSAEHTLEDIASDAQALTDRRAGVGAKIWNIDGQLYQADILVTQDDGAQSVDMTPVTYDAAMMEYKPTGEPVRLTEPPANIERVFGQTADRAVIDEAAKAYEAETAKRLEEVKSALTKLRVEPLVAEALSPEAQTEIAKALKRTEGTADATAQTVIDAQTDNIEGAILGRKSDKPIIALGKNASAFTTTHEFFHYMWDTTLKDIPDFADAVNVWFDWLAEGSTDQSRVVTWRKTKQGKTILQEIEIWRKGDRKQMGVQMEEMLARAVEVTLARTAESKDGRKLLSKPELSVLNRLYDTIPTAVRNAFERIAELLASLWEHINTTRPRQQRELYMAKNLPLNNTIRENILKLAYFNDFKGEHAELVDRIKSEATTELQGLREQMITALEALNKKSKLPYISFYANPTQVRAAIEQQTDLSVDLMSNMAVNIAMMKAQDTHRQALQTIVTELANKTVLPVSEQKLIAPGASKIAGRNVTLLSSLAKKVAYLNAVRATDKSFTRKVLQEKVSEQLENFWREQAIPNLYANEVVSGMLRNRDANATWTQAEFERNALLSLSKLLVPNRLESILRDMSIKNVANEFVRAGLIIEHDASGERIQNSYSTAAALARFVQTYDPETGQGSMQRQTEGVLGVEPTGRAVRTEAGLDVGVEAEQGILTEADAKTLMFDKVDIAEVIDELGLPLNELKTQLQDYVDAWSARLPSEQNKAQLASMFEQTLEKINNLAMAEDAPAGKDVMFSKRHEQEWLRKQDSITGEFGDVLRDAVEQSERDVGMITPETVDQWFDSAKEIIEQHKDGDPTRLLSKIKSPHIRLAAMITIANNADKYVAVGKYSDMSYKLVRELSRISSEFGRTGVLLKEIYKTEPGRQLQIDALDQALRQKGKKEGVKRIKQIKEKVGRLIEKENLTDKEAEQAVKRGIKDVKDGRDADRTLHAPLAGWLSNRFQNVVSKTIDNYWTKLEISEDMPFYSLQTPSNKSKLDLRGALKTILSSKVDENFANFNTDNEQLLNSIRADLLTTHPEIKKWSSDARYQLEKVILDCVHDAGVGIYSDFVSAAESFGFKVDDMNLAPHDAVEVSNKQNELNNVVDALVMQIKTEAGEPIGKISDSKFKLAKAVNVIMDIIKQRALVERGRKVQKLSTQDAGTFLAQLSQNVEQINEVWTQAQEQLSEQIEGMFYPERVQDFMTAVLNSPYAERQVRKALGGYLNWMNVESFPELLRNKVTDSQANVLRQIATNVMNGLAESEIAEADLSKAADNIAIQFVDHMIRNYNFNPELANDLLAQTHDQLMSWLRPKVEQIVDVQGETSKLVRSIISDTQRADFNPQSREGLLARQLMIALRTFNIIPKNVTGQQLQAVYNRLGVLAVSAKDASQAMQNTVSLINDTLMDTLKTEKIAPETSKTVQQLHTVLNAIEGSKELAKFVEFPVLKSQIDQAINQTMNYFASQAEEFLKSDKKARLTFRDMAHWTRQESLAHIKNITNMIVERTGVTDRIAADKLARAIARRMLTRLNEARSEQLNAIMNPNKKKLTQQQKDITERVMERVYLGALETPEMANELARYVGLNGLTNAERLKLLGMSRDIERRGNILKRAYAKRLGYGDTMPPVKVAGLEQDAWVNSTEYRLMLRDFNAELTRTGGFSMLDKATSWYFASLLSGTSTFEVNVASTGLQSLAHTMAQSWAINMKDSERTGTGMDFMGFMKTFTEWGKAFYKSLPSAWHLYVTNEAWGPAVSEYASSTRHPGGIESGMFTGFVGKLVEPFKFAMRGLQAMDFAFANSNTTALTAALARRLAHSALHDSTNAFDVEIAERLIAATLMQRASKFNFADAKDVAFLRSELTKLDGKLKPEQYAHLAHRIDVISEHMVRQAFFEVTGEELSLDVNPVEHIDKLDRMSKFKIYQKLNEMQFMAMPDDMQADLRRSAGEATFNFKADATHPAYEHTYAAYIINAVEDLRYRIPALKFIVPFVRIVGQVTSSSMDYSPVGLYRAAALRKRMMTENGTLITQRDIDTMQAKGAFGVMSLAATFTGALMSLLAKGDGDDDDDKKDWFQITGKGHKDRAKTNAWREQSGYGYQEFSVRMGKKWFSYRYTPLALSFVWLGGIMDNLRYEANLPRYMKMSKEERKATDQNLFKFISQATLNGSLQSMPGMLEQTYMQSISDFMEILSTPNEELRQSKLARLIGRTASTFVAPNFLKQLYRTVDPSLYSVPEGMNTIVGETLRDLPYLPPSWKNNVLLQRYNALGEPIRLNSPSVFTSLIENIVRQRENRPSNLGRFVSVGRREDPVWTWLAKRDVRLPSISQHEMLLGIPMTDEIRQEYARVRGKIMRNILTSMIDSGFTETLSDDKAQELVSSLSRKVGNSVKSAMATDRRMVLELMQARRPQIYEKFGIILPD